jgi:hypothetical protein
VLDGGARQEDVIAGLVSSPEYYIKHGSDDAAFIRGLYEDILGRSASPAEVESWLGVLALNSRTAIARAFVTSDEFRTTLLDGFYQRYLGRHIDGSGLSTWLRQLQGGATQEQIEAALLTSGEYQQRVARQYGDPNQGFILGLYRHVLNRSALDGDVNSWIGVLDQSGA